MHYSVWCIEFIHSQHFPQHGAFFITVCLYMDLFSYILLTFLNYMLILYTDSKPEKNMYFYSISGCYRRTEKLNLLSKV